MTTFQTLLDLACGRPLPEEDAAPARRLQLCLYALLTTVIFAALYGLAAGSTDLSLALGNLYKVPMVIVLSTLAALPAGLLAWKLMGTEQPVTDLLLGIGAGNLAASLVLAVSGPIVALYYHSSGFFGGALAIGACVVALIAGLLVMLRTVLRQSTQVSTRAMFAVPTVVVIIIQLASLLQFIHIASPILPEVTVFDGGADRMISR